MYIFKFAPLLFVNEAGFFCCFVSFVWKIFFTCCFPFSRCVGKYTRGIGQNSFRRFRVSSQTGLYDLKIRLPFSKEWIFFWRGVDGLFLCRWNDRFCPSVWKLGGWNTGSGTGGGFQIMRCISPKHGVLPIGKYNVPPGISPKSLAIPSRTTVIHQFLNVFCRAPIRQQDAFFCFSQISGKTFTENSVFAVRTSLLQTRKSVCAKCAYDGFFSFLKRLLNSG